jgi:hypothetical protein
VAFAGRHPGARDLTRGEVFGAHQALGGTLDDAVMKGREGLAGTGRPVEEHSRNASRQYVGHVTPARTHQIIIVHEASFETVTTVATARLRGESA